MYVVALVMDWIESVPPWANFFQFTMILYVVDSFVGVDLRHKSHI